MKTKLNLEQTYILLGLGFTGDFSLQNMLELVPPRLEDKYDIQITYVGESPDQKWGIYYMCDEDCDIIDEVGGRNELIDTLFDWLVFLKHNNYLNEKVSNSTDSSI